MVEGGGEQSARSIPNQFTTQFRPTNTNVKTEIEMVNNRPTPDRVDDLRR